MLIQEKIREARLSPAEEGIARFLLENKERIQKMRAADLAAATFTSSPAVVRFCHKLGYSGWTEFRDAYYEEVSYLNRHFQKVDPNIPFHKGDSVMEIAGRIGALYAESIEDTLGLLKASELTRAVDLICKAKKIALLSVSNVNYYASEFAYNLERIDKRVVYSSLAGEIHKTATELEEQDVAIILSYSGETTMLKRAIRFLVRKKVPIIAITSIGGNTVSEHASAVLSITTREKSYSKIAGYTSALSFHLVLDILYSCIFERDYSKNLEYKIRNARFEYDRGNSSNEILREEMLPEEDFS